MEPELTMEQRLKSMPTASDPPELQKMTHGLVVGPDGAELPAGTRGRATPHPVPSAEIAKAALNLYLFGNKTRARLVTTKEKRRRKS